MRGCYLNRKAASVMGLLLFLLVLASLTCKDKTPKALVLGTTEAQFVVGVKRVGARAEGNTTAVVVEVVE